MGVNGKPIEENNLKKMDISGWIVKRLDNGLQNRVGGFDSRSALQEENK